MKDKGHFYTSLVKSCIRLVGSALAFLLFLAEKNLAGCIITGSLFVAEVVGVLEEVWDKR